MEIHFEYIPVRLFDFNAKDYYNSKNPLVRILLPKMGYSEEDQETAMITQYIKEKGIQQGIQQGEIRLLCRLIAKKYGLSENVVQTYL